MARHIRPGHPLYLECRNAVNHFTGMVGIALFESDPDVIEAAADRQMAHVRTYQIGKHSAASQKILNEISAAKICLLNPKQRAAYDDNLRRQLDAASPPATPANALADGELLAQLSAAVAAAEPMPMPVRLSAQRIGQGVKRSKGKPWRMVAMFAPALVLLLGLVIWAGSRGRREAEGVAQAMVEVQSPKSKVQSWGRKVQSPRSKVGGK